MNQFNIYKFIELKHKLKIYTSNWNDYDRELALKIIEEWCWTYPRQMLFSKWQNHHQQPQKMRPTTTINNKTKQKTLS